MISLSRATLPVAVLFSLLAACSSSSKSSSDGAKICTPGAYVYCRCENRAEGTKLCHDDGATFDDCKCDGSNPPDPTDPGPKGDGNVTPVPPAPPPPPGAPKIDASCAGKLGVVAGSDADLDAYVATFKADGSFDVAKSHGPALRGPATLNAAGGALVATYLSRYQLISWTKLQSGTWAPPTSVGSAMTTDNPSATLFNGDLKLVYLGTDGHMYQGSYTTAGWDDATLLAESSTGTAPPGVSAPAAAGVGSSLIVVAAGTDGTLGRETYSSNTWGPWIKAPEKAIGNAPALVALEPGGARDLLLLWTEDDVTLHAAAREPLNKTWSQDYVVDSAAATTEVASTALADGTAVIVYRASNNQGYFTIYDPAHGFSAPAELLPGKNPELASVPSITRGRCGSAATLAYAQKSDGAVKVLRLISGKWDGPFDVGAIPKADWVGVGELP
jgi:hypothetical protein